jgi:orotate phosphoribosyltransferase
MKTFPFAIEMATLLLETKAVKFNFKHPFTLRSGLISPMSCENRILFSDVNWRRKVIDYLSQVINGNEFNYPDMLCAVSTASIKWGTCLADKDDFQFGYTLSMKINHLEKGFLPGKSLIIIDDQISLGISTVHAIESLKAAEMKLIGMVSIFNYGIKKTEYFLREQGIETLSLCDFATVTTVAKNYNYICDREHEFLINWHNDLNSH